MQTTFTNTHFTSQSQDDTLTPADYLLEEEEMLSRYHFENTIYLYGVFEKHIAYQIINTNLARTSLKLYETPMTAKKATQNANIQEPQVLRFAVNIPFEIYTYDELIEESKILVKKSGVTLKEYVSKCKYVRKYNTKEKYLEYTINDMKLIVNAQVL